MNTPHSSWAGFYDLAYELTFGQFYQSLTDATVRTINERVSPPARIVDFGAGTGRLSIPLANRGFEVTAVEPCHGMIEQLKAKPGGENVECVHSTVQNFRTDTPFDIGLFVFTVLLYLTDEEELEKALEAVTGSLRKGGWLLIDIPTIALFQSFVCNAPQIERSVTISPIHGDLFEYFEDTTLILGGEHVSYSDRFRIRYWKSTDVLSRLAKLGFRIAEDISGEFCASGSSYYLLQKN